MQKVIQYYGINTRDVNQYLEKGWVIKDIKITAFADGWDHSSLTTVILEKDDEKKEERKQPFTDEQIKAFAESKEFQDLKEVTKGIFTTTSNFVKDIMNADFNELRNKMEDDGK